MSPDLEKMPMTNPTKRIPLRKVFMVILSLFLAHRLLTLLFAHSGPGSSHKKHIEVHTDRGYGEMYKLSWQGLTEALNAARPRIADVGAFEAVNGIGVDQVDRPTSVDVINMTPSDIATLRTSHSTFAHAIRDGGKLSVIYQRGHQGIVITATLNELPQVLIQLRLLRRTGSSLPVEVFLLSQDDFDSKICRGLFPKLNAQCTILEEHLDSSTMPLVPLSRRERKIEPQEPLNKLLAVYFSRFEDVLLLDPSTLVYNNPDMMLKEEPFLSTGMLLWPDFWASTVSPKLYAVQSAAVQKPNRRDNIRTVDMGQVIISKSHQSATLLLAIYYTYYGPRLYDSLLQQSSAGEQGSQAIKSAARYLEAPYYMMKRHVEAVGFPDLDSDNEGFRGVAMLQAFASDDFHRLPKDRQRPVFIRQNNPPLHPAYIMDRSVTVFTKQSSDQDVAIEEGAGEQAASIINENGKMTKLKAAPAGGAVAGDKLKSTILSQESPFSIPARAPTALDRGMHHRMWDWFSARYASNGWRDPDPERAIWEEVATLACVDHKKFRVWPVTDPAAAQLLCQRINYHRAQLGWKDFFVL
jgi:alpha 1,2-mannosyltransferase